MKSTHPILLFTSPSPYKCNNETALHNVMIRIAVTSQHWQEETFICKVHIFLYISTIDFTDQNEQVSALCWSFVWLLYALSITCECWTIKLYSILKLDSLGDVLYCNGCAKFDVDGALLNKIILHKNAFIPRAHTYKILNQSFQN